MKSRLLYWLSGTLLGSEWEGHPPRGRERERERFNLKSVQLTDEHSSCASVCVCVCVRERGDPGLRYNLIKSDFDTTSTVRFCSPVSAGAQVMSKLCSSAAEILPSYSQILDAYQHKHTPFSTRAQSGAVRGCGGTGSVAHGLCAQSSGGQ